MNKDRLIRHKSIIHSKTYTEKDLYVDDIDQAEDDMKCNICEKEFLSIAISWDIRGVKKNKAAWNSYLCKF